MWGDAAAALRRRGPAVLAYAVLLFAIVWVAEKAFGKGFGTTGNAPQFVIVALNGVSLAALYFVTASGFTLVFGLMRVVNMAHGALYLLGGYLALEPRAARLELVARRRRRDGHHRRRSGC